MDPLSIVVDEVALEGLDGITIPTLWIRLENTKPTFPLKLDPNTKEFIWKSLVNNTELNFYELPQDRENVVLVDRFESIDPDTGIEYSQGSADTKTDIYSIHIIPGNKDGIQGSCVFFKERTDVTKHVRPKSLSAGISLEEAFQRYGRKLVIVASQALRFRALIGLESDPELKLTDDSYCILERVGRARWQGELQRDMHVCSFKTDARKFHYMRMSLVKHGLVTMQSHVLRLQSGQQQHSILLLLKRFHVNRRSKYDILMELTSNFLEQIPDQLTSLAIVREQLNLNERTSKHVFQYMRAAKMIEFVQIPLEELNPNIGPCTTKRGSKLLTRCVKLLKPYSRKDAIDDDEEKEDEDEEDESRVRRRPVPSEGRIMEKDFLSQAYHIVLSSGTTGISQRALGYRMNVGKLEARMLCRKLERDDLVKTFMEDEGRQRTTKYISHKCVGVSDRMQQFAKEQERNKLLYSSAPQTSNASTAKTPSNSRAKAKGGTKTLSAKEVPKAAGDGDSKEVRQSCGDADQDTGDEGLDGHGVKARKMTAEKKGKVGTKETKLVPISHPTQTKCESPDLSKSSTNMKAASESVATAEEDPAEEREESVVNPASPSNQTDTVNTASNPAENSNIVVKDIVQQQVSDVQEASKVISSRSERNHETYRLLRRKNLIVEAVRTLKIIEGLFPLQKMINDEEKLDGCSTKCCKKTILRLIQKLSREGLLKLFTTTVIQDGISKKVEMVVHPSVQPSDDIVKRAIEKVRFRISSSYSVVRQQQAEEKAREQARDLEDMAAKSQKSKADKKRIRSKDDEKFNPTIVKGMSRTWGFQPKMHRLRLVHTFLWHLIYGHPCSHKTTGAQSSSQTPIDTKSSNLDAEHTGTHESPVLSNQSQSGAKEDANNSTNTNEQTQMCVNPASGTAVDLQAADSALSMLADEEEDLSNLNYSESDIKVYMDEDSWKRFVPSIRVHKEFGHGWAMMRDLLLCLPLSLFIQVTQINYKVDGLEEYLNDPVKQHYLVRVLPCKMRRQLLYKRKYIFSFYENLQRLAYMGLLQFGPVEKFKEKDQVFVYLRQKVTIVDTTNAEPHYWLITESPDKPFERRQYTLTTAEDVENYWFDLMCVCLNTPLGVIRSKRGGGRGGGGGEEEEATPSFVRERNVFIGMAYLLKGSREVCDDGSVPGDGKGAGGLDSEFFAHLKRNWLWTSYLLSVKSNPSSGEVNDSKIRLKSLLTKNALRIALKAGESTSPRYVTAKRPLITDQNVEVVIEPASRNQQVAGGKRQKRKRSKKEVIKIPRKKKKEPRKRTPAHDEADHRALKMMTKQRVYWSVQEDSLMMLCSVASHLLNSKLKRPFIAYCVIRDLLQAEIEISMDKTSLAVARRTRYILKNPQTLLNYRICLAEVYQDKALMKLLEEKKPTNPDSPDNCAQAFSEYARLLRQKFSSIVNSCDVIMPDTKHQLFSWFKVCTIDNDKGISYKDVINCTGDIHAIVLNNLIQSTLAMSNYQMKTCRSFQTFHIYGRYDQELLCRVFLWCRKAGLVNRRRVNPTTGPKKNRALPILPMSYQLSQSYYKRFSWRFPPTLCTDVFRFLRSLIDKGTGDDRPMTAFYHETMKRAENGEEVLQRGAVTQRKDKESQGNKDSRPLGELEEQSGKANSGLTKEEQTDQRKIEGEDIQLELNVDKAEATSKKDEQNLLKNAEDSFTHDPSGQDQSCSEQTEGHQPQIDQPVLHPASNSSLKASKQPPDVSGLLRYSLESPGGACAACLSLMTLGLLSIYVSIPKQMVVVDSSLVESDFVKSLTALDEEDDDDDDGEDNERTKRLEVKAHQASHTKYLMMRGYCCPGIVKLRNLNTNDNIVVESAIMRLQLRNTPAHKIFDVEDSLLLNLNKCGPSLVPSILTCSIHPPSSSIPCMEKYDKYLIEEKSYTPQDVEVCVELRKSLDKAGEKGLSIYDLYQTHKQAELQCGRTRSLQQYMEELQHDGQVLKVGGLGVRWVLMRHAEPWLLTTNCKPWSQSPGLRPLWENRHKIPFIRKRSRAVQQEVEEPLAKKVAEDKDGDEDGEGADGLSSKITEEKLNKEQQLKEQKAGEDEKRGEKLLNSSEDEVKPTLPEEIGEEEAVLEKVETERRLVRLEEKEREKKSTEDRIETERDDEASFPSAGPAAPDENGNLSFISRPWRLVDGKLNRQVCKGMMESVLYHIMSRPGLTQQALLEHYKGILQPMAVMDLLQALIELGCVSKRALVKAPKPSLFSHSAGQTRGQTEVRVEEPDTVFYEPTISCCLRLAQVLPNERHWNSFM
ncbi:hypothetical protein LDENG_00237400 [Lucifuga dentata]|nr:hypothetical protein LDENG_00237400 [Lucifuga dentata]